MLYWKVAFWYFACVLPMLYCIFQMLAFTKASSASLESQVNAITKENESSKTEVKEVLQALEELAVNYDQKLQEVDQKSKENENFMEELNTKQNELSKCVKDIDQLNETMNIMKRKVTEITNTLLEELVSLFNRYFFTEAIVV